MGCQGFSKFPKDWVDPKPIPDKASHPNVSQVQSIAYAERADQPGHAAKHKETNNKSTSEKDGKFGACGWSAQKKRNKTENREGWPLSGAALADNGKIEKIQDRPPGLEFSSGNETFN